MDYGQRLTIGESYCLDFFLCERHTWGSNVRIEVTVPPVLPPASFDRIRLRDVSADTVVTGIHLTAIDTIDLGVQGLMRGAPNDSDRYWTDGIRASCMLTNGLTAVFTPPGDTDQWAYVPSNTGSGLLVAIDNAMHSCTVSVIIDSARLTDLRFPRQVLLPHCTASRAMVFQVPQGGSCAEVTIADLAGRIVADAPTRVATDGQLRISLPKGLPPGCYTVSVRAKGYERRLLAPVLR